MGFNWQFKILLEGRCDMAKRKVDKTKKSNIKCEHCIAWDRPTKEEPFLDGWCCIHECRKNYWNRCKDFKWDTKY